MRVARPLTFFIFLVVSLCLGSNANAQSCPNPSCSVAQPLYKATCTAAASGGLNCSWGGPGLCCNPAIKASVSYKSGDTCTAATNGCLVSVSGNTQTSYCCCNSVNVSNGCAGLTSNGICQTSTKIG
jgi:hypothetical protein